MRKIRCRLVLPGHALTIGRWYEALALLGWQVSVQDDRGEERLMDRSLFDWPEERNGRYYPGL